jgi:hypothetical protein
VEDVIIKVDKFYYLEKQIPIILGLHFLVTANACINCRTQVMKISFGNIKIRLNIFNAFQNAPDQKTCLFLDDIGETVEDPPPVSLSEAPSWRNLPEPMLLTSSTPPPDDNPTGDIIHSEVTEVDFLGVDNFLAIKFPSCLNF